MPATAGRVRMPHNNRMSTSSSLKTTAIWQKAIGHDPYAGNEAGGEGGAGGGAGEAVDEAGRAKAKEVMEAARKQNLTDGANRDDFARRMYLGLKGGKKRRADLLGQSLEKDEELEKMNQLLAEESSSSEDEFVEVDVDGRKAEEDEKEGRKSSKKRSKKRKKEKKRKKKKHKKKRSRRDDYSSDDDSDSSSESSDESSDDDDDRRRRKKRRKRSSSEKRKHKKKRGKHRSSESDDSDSEDSRGNSGSRKKGGKSSSSFKKKENKKKTKKRDMPEFVASVCYGGSKEGYVFKNDELGVGYYIDNRPPCTDPKDLAEMLKLYSND